MSIKSTAVSVGTTATRLDTADDTGDHIGGESLAVYNNGASTLYLGGSNVTTSTGVPVAANSWGPALGGILTEDALYGIVTSGTVDVRVLEAGV